MSWLYFAALAMVATAVVHSYAGERKLVRPLLDGTHPPLNNAQSRKVLRSAWHLTSGFMVICAAVVVWPGTPSDLVALIGGFWCVLGLFSLIASRGKHVGWPTLITSGVFALIGTMG